MRFLVRLTICISFLVTSYTYTNAQTTFILLRHAEKAKDHPMDPSLNIAGKERALKFKDLFAHADIQAIYSTAYKRTRNTVYPLAEQKSLNVNEYQPFEKGFLQTLLDKYPNGTVVIVGHSNTTPTYVNALTGSKLPNLGENEYDKIFVVTASEIGNGKTTILKF